MSPVDLTFANPSYAISKGMNETHPKQNSGSPRVNGDYHLSSRCSRRATVTGCPAHRQGQESYCLRPYSCCNAAWAAASRAMGTRNGEQET